MGWGRGDILRKSVTNIGNFEWRNIWWHGISEIGAFADWKVVEGDTWQSRQSLILRCPPFATKEVTFDLFTSVRVTWKGGGGCLGWSGFYGGRKCRRWTGSLAKLHRWSHRASDLFHLFQVSFSLSLKKLTKCPLSLVTLDCDMFR